MRLGVLGATGGTGLHVVRQALDAGHEVRVLVRTPAKLSMSHPKLEVLTGDATDAAAVKRLVEGCEAVISALGPTQHHREVCSTATQHVIAAGAKRYVVISGAGVDVPGDQKDLVGKVVSFLVRTLSPAVFHDKVRELELLQNSQVPWTLVRPPRLVDKPGSGQPRMRLDRSPGASISRSDLAAFSLRCVADGSLVRKAPFVAN